MDVPDWAAEYIGIPFKPHGRDRDGADCWGLVRLVLRQQFGKILPSFVDDYADTRALSVAPVIAEARGLLEAKPVFEPEPGDVAIMMFMGHPCHIGVCLGHGYILHVEPGKGAIIHHADGTHLRHRIEGFYRV